MPVLERHDEVFVLRLTPDDENKLNPTWVAEVRALVAEVEAATGPRALVTVGEGKFWSTGLDLDWVTGHAAEPDQVTDFITGVQALYAEVLELSCVSVAALNGHTFAAGAMLAVAHDQSVMRADRGFWCVPEVDISIPFTTGMCSLLQARLSKATAHVAMTTGRRYGGEQAHEAGIVHGVASAHDLLTVAFERAAGLASKAGPTLAAIKRGMYGATLTALRTPEPLRLPG